MSPTVQHCDHRPDNGLPARRLSFLTGALIAAMLAMTGCRGAGREPPDSGDALRLDENATEETPISEPAAAHPHALTPPSAERLAEYSAHKPKTALELQLFRQSETIPLGDGAGEATLIDINPRINSWFVLDLAFPLGGGAARPADSEGRLHAIFHLENPDPKNTELRLDAGFTNGLVIRGAKGETRCELWTVGASGDDKLSPIDQARASGTTYAELCGGQLYLRNRTEGRRTRLEMATDLLRDSVWGGERITTFVRQNLYQDRFLVTSKLFTPEEAAADRLSRHAGAPRRPWIDPRYDGHYLEPIELGLELDNETPRRVQVGRWYTVRNQPGVFVSAIQPKLVASEVVVSLKGRLNPLDEVESSALVYLVAFDLAAFDLGFALGTDHPRVGWSERVLPTVRDDALPGPDGIDDVKPLVRTGRLSPVAAQQVAATFTGGFKRSHGAFKLSALATHHSGSHYGFVENGAVASKLVPGLATAVVWADGTVELKTWTEADNAALGRVRHARQNGVPLIELDADTGTPRPGALVTRRGEGNWSGSQDKRLRSLRAGLCLQHPPTGDGGALNDKGFLIYGYFSGATPSSMVQVFQAYDCRYAMMLDMNALEHTYMALYQNRESRFLTQHLIEGMNVLDEEVSGQQLPRFVAFPDNRDFFYLLRKDNRR